MLDADGLTFPEEELPGIMLALAMMDGDAPARLSIDELATVIHACNFMMAEPLVAGFRKYLLPLGDKLAPGQVRACL